MSRNMRGGILGGGREGGGGGGGVRIRELTLTEIQAWYSKLDASDVYLYRQLSV